MHTLRHITNNKTAETSHLPVLEARRQARSQVAQGALCLDTEGELFLFLPASGGIANPGVVWLTIASLQPLTLGVYVSPPPSPHTLSSYEDPGRPGLGIHSFFKMCMYVRCMCGGACVPRPEVDIGCQSLSTLFIEAHGLLLNLGLTNSD